MITEAPDARARYHPKTPQDVLKALTAPRHRQVFAGGATGRSRTIQAQKEEEIGGTKQRPKVLSLAYLASNDFLW